MMIYIYIYRKNNHEHFYSTEPLNLVNVAKACLVVTRFSPLGYKVVSEVHLGLKR